MRSDLAQKLTTTPYHCRACARGHLATVRSYGFGVGAFGLAAENARRDAQASIPMLLALAACPSCGHRDTALAARNRRTRTAVIAIMAAIFALTSIAVIYIMPLAGIIGAAVMALAFVPLRTAMMLRYPSNVTDQVTFTELPAPATTAVPADIVAQTHSDGGWKWI
jgi:hypothetical protein